MSTYNMVASMNESKVYLREFGKANKAAIRDLLIDKFPDTLSSSQKERKDFTLP